MKRYEAFISKDWRNSSIANVVVARIDDDGGASAGFFLVDHFCLGVRDAILLDNLTEGELRNTIEERFPEGAMERMHPAWAKKFIEGAVDYAENLGFSPHDDYRMARHALSGIDTEVCTETFVYGDNGRPHFMQDDMDDEDSVARILAVLDKRLGPDGYEHTVCDDAIADALEDPDISGEAFAETRALLERALGNIKSKVTVPAIAGTAIAMLCQPVEFDFGDMMEMLEKMLKVNDNTGENPPDERALATLGDAMKIYWSQLAALVDAGMKTGDPHPLDFCENDFPNEDEFNLALIHWAHGFISVVEVYDDAWFELCARPELANHWKTLVQWSDPSAPGGLFEELKKENQNAAGAGDNDTSFDTGPDTDKKRLTPPDAAVAILRAARMGTGEQWEEQGADE